MPIIKSAKKRMRQNEKRRARRFPIRNQMKTVFKNALALVKDGKLPEAKAMIPHAYSVIDMACKKNIIHPNTASRKKSRLARSLNALEMKMSDSSAPVADKKEKAEA